MNSLELTKTAAKIGTADTATDATFTHSIDTLGFDYASVDVVFEAGTAVTQDLALVLTVGESDDNTTLPTSPSSSVVARVASRSRPRRRAPRATSLGSISTCGARAAI